MSEMFMILGIILIFATVGLIVTSIGYNNMGLFVGAIVSALLCWWAFYTSGNMS